MSKLIDLTGQKFGRLIVVRREDNNKQGKSRWLCKCECKNEIIIVSSSLRGGLTQSCGCLQKEIVTQRLTIHGHKKDGKVSREYQSWQDMKDRCTNPNNRQWKDYGGREITVCKRWLNSFPNFLKDMGEVPEGYQIDRIGNSKGYYKENCRWTTRKEQTRNKQNNIYIIYKGKQRLFVELCEEHNVPRQIVYGRYYRYGWTLEEALTIPVGEKRKN